MARSLSVFPGSTRRSRGDVGLRRPRPRTHSGLMGCPAVPQSQTIHLQPACLVDSGIGVKSAMVVTQAHSEVAYPFAPVTVSFGA